MSLAKAAAGCPADRPAALRLHALFCCRQQSGCWTSRPRAWMTTWPRASCATLPLRQAAQRCRVACHHDRERVVAGRTVHMHMGTLISVKAALAKVGLCKSATRLPLATEAKGTLYGAGHRHAVAPAIRADGDVSLSVRAADARAVHAARHHGNRLRHDRSRRFGGR